MVDDERRTVNSWGMSDDDIMARHGLSRIINVAGTMTALGASLAVPEAIAAGAAIQSQFVDMDALQARASRVIAAATGAESGCVTACSAAGIALGIAGAMTGSDLARIEQLPDTTGLKDEVVIQAGHLINYGAPIDQAIRITGAKVKAAGSAARVETYHLENAINERTAAALFVVSHHVVQEGQTALGEFIVLCKARNVPVIVDMASEYDLTGPIVLGADLVVHSAHKFLGGPTAGIVAGRKDLVRAAYLQNRGLGRHMKVGKESILGTVAALEAWSRRDHAVCRARELAVVAGWRAALAGVPGLAVEQVPDWTGNPIDRLKVTVMAKETGLHAWELADRLAAGEPSIRVRDDLIEHGYFFLDPCNLKPGEDTVVAAAIRATIEAARRQGDGPGVTLAQRRGRAIEATLKWPD
jgi:L-seryl-tRNA(Ser) seleniumtransferase